MLHLQLASNIAKALGVMPSYTGKALVDGQYGWVCYGPDQTVLPHILDFEDTVAGYNDIKVKLDALTVEQNRLFLAIEENGRRIRLSHTKALEQEERNESQGYLDATKKSGGFGMTLGERVQKRTGRL